MIGVETDRNGMDMKDLIKKINAAKSRNINLKVTFDINDLLLSGPYISYIITGAKGADNGIFGEKVCFVRR